MTFIKYTGLQDLVLHRQIEDLFFTEADLLDERRFDEWLGLFTEDVRYWMPLVRNVQYGQETTEYSREGVDNAWIDEGKETLAQRVKQLKTGIHWAEEPRSRMSHLITNIRIEEVRPTVAEAAEVVAKSRILVYRNRLEADVDIVVGKRRDTLRFFEEGWKISRREVFLDQNVLLVKNLTTFF